MDHSTCSVCGLRNMYKSANTTWSGDGILVKALGDKVTEVFATQAFLCVDCGHLDIYVAGTAAALFGKGKPLKESIALSENWKRVGDND